MSQWGLTEKERAKITGGAPFDQNIASYVQAVQDGTVQTTLRHVYEEGGKPCPHQSYPRHEVKRRECPQCWEELKQEAGL